MECKEPKLYLETPVVYSHALSKRAGFKVYLKLDNLQPSGSFKLRGISNMIQKVSEWLFIFMDWERQYQPPQHEYYIYLVLEAKECSFIWVYV